MKLNNTETQNDKVENAVVNTQEENLEQEEENVQVVEKVVEKIKFAKFDASKVQNAPEGVTYTNNIWLFSNGPTIEIDENGNVNISDKKINGLSGKVVDVCYSVLGNGSASAIAFLTESGEVYFGYYEASENQINVEKVEDVSNICKLVSTRTTKSAEGRSSTRATIIGIDANGNCYDVFYAAKGV